MSIAGSNYTIRDEIRDYWSERAPRFDESVGHEIFSEAERQGWQALIRRHLGEGQGRRALDLACGTAVISHLMNDAGFKVTGLDWSETMLGLARAKAKERGTDIRFVLGDAENTMEAPDSFDAITNRHLVWTLVDPRAAFREWFTVLKPGGKVLIVDGNMGHVTPVARWRAIWERFTGRTETPAIGADMVARLADIRSRVHFSGEMRANDVCALLREAGFEDIVVDRRLWRIHLAQARRMPFLKGLDRLIQDRYAICATKPLPRS